MASAFAPATRWNWACSECRVYTASAVPTAIIEMRRPKDNRRRLPTESRARTDIMTWWERSGGVAGWSSRRLYRPRFAGHEGRCGRFFSCPRWVCVGARRGGGGAARPGYLRRPGARAARRRPAAGSRQCRVRRRPEVRVDAGRLGRLRESLGEQDADQPLARIRIGGQPETTIPAEAAGAMEEVVAADADAHAESPASVLA